MKGGVRVNAECFHSKEKCTYFKRFSLVNSFLLTKS